mmetsp:Transcript_105003/g.185491  ORF Transcript_105003/g.185491 Transcript_105003/m.185491 type:complete len:288 (+) Transcript_105003:1-864(+)
MGDEGYAAATRLITLVEAVSKRQVVQQGVPIMRMGGWGSSPDNEDEQIDGGIVVDPVQYLLGLWEVVQAQAKANGQMIHWERKKVKHWSDLALDLPSEGLREVTICAMGIGIMELWNDANLSLPLTLVRGRNIVVERPEGVSKNDALLRGEYVVPNYGGQKLILGATHEWEWSPGESEGEDAIQKLWATLQEKGFLEGEFATLGTAAVDSYTDAVRLKARRTHVGRIPIVARHPKKHDVWVMTGFGARGLIHHANLAELVLKAALAGDASFVPKEVFWNDHPAFVKR